MSKITSISEKKKNGLAALFPCRLSFDLWVLIQWVFAVQLKGVESKLQPFKLEIDEKTYWLNETEMTLKSPKMNFDNDKMSSDELARQYSVLEVRKM